jgi:hypothetical protein
VVAAKKLPPRSVDRITTELKPRLEAVLTKSSELATLLEASRFWLGARLYEVHSQHLTALKDYAITLTERLYSGDWVDTVELVQRSIKARPRFDVETLLEEIAPGS